MNDNTAKLLDQLAQKMGTTASYLWHILLKQAPVSATTSLVQAFLVALFGVFLWKMHKWLSRKIPESKYGRTRYEESDSAVIPMAIGALIFGILAIYCLCDISNIINGYFNPEYWALDQILSTIKN